MTRSLFHSLQFSYITILFSKPNISEPCSNICCCSNTFPRIEDMAEKAKSSGSDLGLNLSPPRDVAKSPSADHQSLDESSNSSAAGSSISEVSCVSSSEANKEETKAWLLVGCLRCLMYVLLPRPLDPNPTCPNCNSTVLLDIVKNLENKKKKKEEEAST